MFKTILLKSVAGAAAAGTVLAGALVATPAVTVASPQIRTVACEIPYENSIVTTTGLSLERQLGQYGAQNAAHVRVTSDTGATPTGRVRVTVVGVDSYTVALEGGKASVNIFRRLPAQNTYEVFAQYLPGCSRFKASTSGSKFYTVKRANTRVYDVQARDIRQGGTPRVHAAVDSTPGLTPRGSIRVRLFKNSDMKRVKTVRLSGGEATVRFAEVQRAGLWDVTVTYLGTSNFHRDGNTADFRARR